MDFPVRVAEATLIAVVMVNYRSVDAVARLLESLKEFHMVVVNNDVRESEALEGICDKVPFHLIEAGANVGYGTAINRGVESLPKSYRDLIFVNPDVQVDALSLSRLTSIRRRRHAALAVPRLTMPNGAIWRTAFTQHASWRAIAADFAASRLSGDSLLVTTLRSLSGADASFGPSRWIRAATGALWSMDRGWFEDLGGFDEDIFLYGEESEFCVRLERAGGRVWFEGSISAIHEGGGSSQHMSRRALRIAGLSKQMKSHERRISAAILSAVARRLRTLEEHD